MALTDTHPELALAPQVGLQVVERELTGRSTDAAAREHVFNLLALVLEREPVRIAALAFDSDDAYLRGTALEYLETVLPSGIFAALAPRLSTAPAPLLHQRGAAVVRAELLEAAATIPGESQAASPGAERPISTANSQHHERSTHTRRGRGRPDPRGR